MCGRVVILSGPSGVGKDSVIEAWKRIRPGVKRVVSYTTRKPRQGERDGIDYNFIERSAFMDKVLAGEFLEWKTVHGELYGTPWRDLNAIVEEGQIAVLKIDVQGAMTVMEKLPEAVSIFLLPPTLEELERRIRTRETDSEETIRLRLQNARTELTYRDKYQYCVVNDDLERAAAEVDQVVMSIK